MSTRMTRHDYEVVASAVAASYALAVQADRNVQTVGSPRADAVRRVASELASRFERESERFDRERFMRAALGEE